MQEGEELVSGEFARGYAVGSITSSSWKGLQRRFQDVGWKKERRKEGLLAGEGGDKA